MRFLREYWLLAVGMFVSLLIATASMLVIPRMSQYVIDEGIIGRDASKVLWMSLAMVGFAGLRALFQFTQGALAARVAEGVAYDMRNALYAKIQSLSFSYHDRAQTGQLLTRATSDVDRVQRFVGRGAISFFSALLMMGGSLVVLFTANWRLALIMVVIIPLTLGVFGLFARKAMPLFKTVQECLANLNTVLQENLAGVRVVKAFVREPYESSRYEAANRAFYDVSIEVNTILSLGFPTIFGIANVAILSVYWIGGTQVIGGILTVGQLVAFASYFMMAFFPVLMLGMIVASLSNAAASAERVFDILDARSEVVEKPDAVTLPPIEGRVAFENVTFRYYDTGEPVLRGVSFVAEPGEAVALLGATGSGKSTIINLIPRFYDISGDGCKGRVTVDGYDVRDVRLDSLRAQTGIVLQEATLFEGTIRENIAFGRPEASLEEIIEVAKAAEAHDFIMSFAQGYETHVGERGVTLSGGQKQRIAIARVLLHDPKILILDDATSSVDLVTEYRIHQALSRLMKGRTSFVIAQRVATVLNADQILVLDNGEIVARGVHEELLASSEIYAEIYGSQLQDDTEQSPDATAVAGATV
ncbi:MAG: ABC transporter ATP-binding protein [Anaerolineales bacterium]|nr:MAG: ABC transporter ATP-binding protein [Anaerolineales bacterium]